MEPIHQKIGKNLNRIRKSRGLSLEKTAELTGVSKAMLGQIERGDSNPTISIIWKIANGLHLSVTSLIEEETPYVSIISPGDIPPLHEENGNYRTYPLFNFDQKKKFEIYAVEIEPGCISCSEPHNEGVEEYIIVNEGTLMIKLGNETYIVEAGSAIRFRADQAHEYHNKADFLTRFQALIYYPS